MTKIIINYQKYFILTLLTFSIFSCSGNSEKDSEVDIFDGRYDSKVFTKESFNELEFKFSKEYDVSELPDAIEAHYGFWKRREFEIRFYPSNQIAKSSGTFYAEEATGEDAIIKKSDATWKEGIKDRSGVSFFGAPNPKYLAYVVFGNVIVLCPSEVSSAVKGAWDPIENCRDMLTKLILEND